MSSYNQKWKFQWDRTCQTFAELDSIRMKVKKSKKKKKNLDTL